MVGLFVVGPNGKVELCDYFNTLAEIVEDVRKYWLEDEGPLLMYAQAEGGAFRVTFLRDLSDIEICHTTYADGRKESHRCHYVLDQEGRYERTEVIAV